MSQFPAVAELLPHTGAMRLLHRVVAHAAEGTRCEALVAGADLFRGADGRIPAWVAIEWMAQCAGVHGALELQARGERLGPGFLTGGRQIALLEAFLPEAGTILIDAKPAGRSGPLHAFRCSAATSEGRLLAEGRLGIFIPRPVPAGQGGR
jgi:predicted hotdog family 3-hydroxylacyl-ACP dehydratase